MNGIKGWKTKLNHKEKKGWKKDSNKINEKISSKNINKIWKIGCSNKRRKYKEKWWKKEIRKKGRINSWKAKKAKSKV